VVRLKRQPDRRAVVFGERVEAGHGLGRIKVHQEAEHAGQREPRPDPLLVGVGPAEEVQVAGPGREVALERGELGRLGLGDLAGLVVPRHQRQDAEHGRNHEADREAAPREELVAAPQQVVRADGQHEERPEDHRPHHRVREPVHAGGVEHHGPEVRDLRPPDGLAVDLPLDDVRAGRRLLPRVGHDDPDRAEDAAEPDQQRGHEMGPGADPIPAENEHRQEPGLQEEREDPLGGQRRAEDVAHKPRVGGPVRSELELHDDAGRDAQREVEREDPRPEARGPVPHAVPRPQPQPLQQDHHEPQPDRQGRKQVVEHDRSGELETAQQLNAHGCRSE
jgi:hypothetical protein